MTISELSVRRSVFAWMIMFSAIVFGAVSLLRLGVSYLPDIDFPILNININWEGASPSVMENEIVDRVEKKIINVEGIKTIQTSIRQGNASITLEFNMDRDVDVAMQELQSYLSQVKLPADVDPPAISKSNPEDSPIIWLGFSGERNIHDLFVFADNNIIDRIKLIPGVGEISTGGSSERSLRVWVNNSRLRSYDLTMLDVRDAISREHAEGASGYLEGDKQDTNLRFMGEGLTPKQIGNILITRRGGSPILDRLIRLRDVAEIEDGLDDVRRIASISGKTGMSIGIRKQRGVNSIAVGNAVLAEVEKIAAQLPKDMTLKPIFNGVRFAQQAVDDTQIALVLSVIMTILVVWLSLGSLSSTFNIFLAIPTSVFGTFLILYFSGFTLNLFTLLGLSLAVGIVVDDAIMILENIVRHFQNGKDRVTAAIEGTNEVFSAAIATTVVLLAIFIPVAFMEGIIGRFFYQFAVTISAAVAFSTLDALTLTPMRASRTLSAATRRGRLLLLVEHFYTSLTRLYEKILAATMRRKVPVMIFSAAALIPMAAFTLLLKSEFVPAQDQSQFGISVKTPVGSSLNHTASRVREIEEILLKKKEVENYIAIIGGFRGGDVNQARIIIVMTPKGARKISQQDFMEKLLKELRSLKDMKIGMFDFASRGLTSFGTYPVEFSIRGSDWSRLKTIAEKAIEESENSKTITNADMDYQEGMPELQIIPNRERAAQMGVSMSNILDTVRISMGGSRIGRFTNDGRRYDIRVKLKDNQRSRMEDVSRLQVRNDFGEAVSLPSLAELKSTDSVQSLSRMDRSRAVNFTARVKPNQSQAVAMKEAAAIIGKYLPPGYQAIPGGSSQSFVSTFESLYVTLVLGIIVAYIALAIQFNSFLYPFIILLAVPFGLGGAITALVALNQSLNLFSLIGVILLTGLATKNSIMLVEFINQKRADGLPVLEAIQVAAPLRLRPIVMTSITSVAAAIPQALDFGTGAEARIPMALTIIGGIVISTLFSLIVVPAAYALMIRWEIKQPVEGNTGISSDQSKPLRGRKTRK